MSIELFAEGTAVLVELSAPLRLLPGCSFDMMFKRCEDGSEKTVMKGKR